MDELLEPRCACDDCEAAVSPGAYLASLLDYALKHVQTDGAPIDSEFLKVRFHQPFADLPIDCEASDRKVRQVRLCVEVLRDYVGSRPLFELGRENALLDAEKEYRLAAYTRLLTLLGTSYGELRRARSGSVDDRKALAQRLGIDLTPDASVPRQDELDMLLLDPDPALPASDPRALMEHALERMFGLADTERDCLSEGVKYGDDQKQIVRWNLNGAYWNVNTDADGVIHLTIIKNSSDSYGVYAYRDAARLHLVAGGERSTPSGTIRLAPQDGSGLSGSVEIEYTADSTGIRLSQVPLLVGWRLRRLRTLWSAEDRPTDSPASDEEQPPLIDPQVISGSDIRGARPGQVAFDLWSNRLEWLSKQRNALKSAREAATGKLVGIETIIAQALSTPTSPVAAADLEKLVEAQKDGERIEQRLREFGITPGEFAFLMPILELVRSGQRATDLERATIYDTLLQVRKRHEFGVWREQEKSRELILSPSYFRISDSTKAPELATSLTVPLWLSTREARRRWVETLEARIAQEDAVIAGFDSTIGSVEGEMLPQLRDALLVASDAEGGSLEERGEWLSQRLLIDFRMAGSQVTTRVAQAIETLQQLLLSLRTGLLDRDTLFASPPLVSIHAVGQGERRIDLFGRGEDDILWHRVWDGRWRSWRARGTLPGAGTSFRPSDPAIAAHGDGRLEGVVRGADRVLWHRRYDSEWLDWQRVEGDLELVGNPSAIVGGPDELIVFALRIGDLQVMQRRREGAKWSIWEETGVTSSRLPAAASWATNRIDLFLGRPSPDLFKPLHRWWDGTAWHDDPLDSILSSDPAAVSSGVNHLDLFQNHTQHLWWKSWDGAWHPWVDLDATLGPSDPHLSAVPAICSRSANALDVFALRSGGTVYAEVWSRHFEARAWSEWEPLPSGHLVLDAPDFDSEWEWIGSYATWRSAMFVWLYPDNLLQPSLVTHRTPAFEALIQQSRPTLRLTPEKACTLARSYSNYLRDVASLHIGATCQVSTNIEQGDPCKSAATVTKQLLYMFGLANSGKVYWSTIDPNERSGYAQSFWKEVPLDSQKDASLITAFMSKENIFPVKKVTKIIGALPWLNRNIDQHYIYVFMEIMEAGESRFTRARFDLDRYDRDEAWEIGSLDDLPFQKNTETGENVPVTICTVQSDSVVDPPQLAVHNQLNIYVRSLDQSGDGWGNPGGNWNDHTVSIQYRDRPKSPGFQTLEAALRVKGVIWIVYQSEYRLEGSKWYEAAPVGGYSAIVCSLPSRFRGALPGSSSESSIFVFYDQSDQINYREIKKTPAPDPALGPAFIATSNLTQLAPHSGWSPTFFATDRNKEFHSYAYYFRARGGKLEGSSRFDVVPVMFGSHNIPTGGSVAALQARRFSVKGVYERNKSASASILTYLTEAYRAVPTQLALSLQASGNYVAALDLFATVYDYRAPQGERCIDHGLEIDAGLPGTGVFRHAEDWLLDPLNPHAVALTRRYAYTRFTIASIIRCLNEFADAEFTQDTSESLVRARLLYTTALELCDLPEMHQELGACEALIGRFEIEPGEEVPPEVAAALGEIAEELTRERAGSGPGARLVLEGMSKLVRSGDNWDDIIPKLQEMKKALLDTVPVPLKAGSAVAARKAVLAKAHSGLLTEGGVEKLAKAAGELAVSKASALIGDRP